MGPLFLLFVGGGYAVPAIRVLRRQKAHTRFLFAASLVAAGAGLALWPTATAAHLDGLTGTPGLGRLLVDLLVTLSFLLQYIFVCVLDGCWSNRRRTVLAVASCFFLVPLVSFSLVQHVVASPEHFVYDGYYGRPIPVLALNLALAVSIFSAAVAALSVHLDYLRSSRRTDERIIVGSAAVVFVSGAIYTVLISLQAVVNALGGGATAVMAVTGPIVGIAGSIGLFATLGMTVGRPLFDVLLERLSLHEQRRLLMHERQAANDALNAGRVELDQLMRQISDLNTLLSDGLVRLDSFSHDGLKEVLRCCTVRRLPAYQRKVALEAARVVLLNTGALERFSPRQQHLPNEDIEVLDDAVQEELTAQERDEVAQTFAYHARREMWLYGDVFRVAAQVIDARVLMRLDIMLPDAADDWRRDVASLVSDALHRRGVKLVG